jgi:hypothetical protein
VLLLLQKQVRRLGADHQPLGSNSQELQIATNRYDRDIDQIRAGILGIELHVPVCRRRLSLRVISVKGLLDERSKPADPGFAAACALGPIYGFLQGAWPVGLVEALT